MKQLITADWHITHKEKDAYRWDALKYLTDYCVQHNIDQFVILGDITEEKDNHNGVVVNAFVDKLNALAHICKGGVYILEGNHDFRSDLSSYWEFVSFFKNIHYVSNPGYVDACKAYFLPYKVNDLSDVKGDCLFMHHLVSGAQYQTYKAVDGFSFQDLPKLTISGHIHAPQRMVKRRGALYYVGSPYSVHFGDHFSPRFLIRDTDTNEIKSISSQGPVKWSINYSTPKDLDIDFREGDFVKIDFAADLVSVDSVLPGITEMLQKCGVIFAGYTVSRDKDAVKGLVDVGLSQSVVFEEFCRRNNLSSAYEDLGKQCIE